MKKRMFVIAFVISAMIGLSACKNPPIFAAIEQEVKLTPASVKGFIRRVVELNGTLYTSNGKIYSKIKGTRETWSEMSGCPSGYCTGIATDGANLYAAFSKDKAFTVHKYTTATSSWSEVSGLTAQAVFGTKVVFAINKESDTAYTISAIENGSVSSTWTTSKAPIGAADSYCLLEDGLYDKTGAKIPASPASELKGICEGPSSNAVFVVDSTKLYCYDGSAWTNIAHGVSSPQSITYLPNKQLVLISGVKGYGEIKLASASDTNLGAAKAISVGSDESSVPAVNIHQYNNSVGKYVINPITALENGSGYIIYVGVNDPNTKYSGLWGFYYPDRIEWNRE